MVKSNPHYEVKTHYEGRTSRTTICMFDSYDSAKKWLDEAKSRFSNFSTTLHIRRVTTTILIEDIHE